MVVQAIEGVELSGAEVAFVGLAVPGALCGDGFDIGVAVESDHGAGNDVVAVELANHVVDLWRLRPEAVHVPDSRLWTRGGQ